MHTVFWLETLKERDHLEDLGEGGKIGLEWILGKQGERMSAGFTWLRIGTNGGLL
jgi:hypothetical protein